MTGALWGLFGAVLIGSADACARHTAQRASLGALLTLVMGLSTLALAAAAAALDAWPPLHLWGWLAAAGSGALTVVALGFLWTALARGPVSVASPAAASFAVLLVAANAFAGAPFGWTEAAATALVFLAVARLARAEAADAGAYPPAHVRRTLALALGAAGLVATRFYLAQDSVEALGAFSALLLNRGFAALAALVWAAAELRAARLRPPSGRVWLWVGAQTAFETSALAAFLIGSTLDRVGAGVGFAAFPAVTVALAALFMGERVGPRRAFWVAAAVAGAMLASA